MGVAYDKVTTQDPELNQVQAHVEAAFASVPDVPTQADGIVRLDTARGAVTYQIRDADRHVVVITNGAKATIALPSPKIKRTLGVIASGANPVTVQRSDGLQNSFGVSKTLTNEASLFVSDGTDWYLG